MSDTSNIPKQILQNLKNIAEETGKEAIKQVGEMVHAVISPKELLGDITNLPPEELARRKQEDERKRQEEMAKIRAQIQGRNVGAEMQQIERQEEQEKKQEEDENLRRIRMLRQQEEAERAQMVSLSGESANPAHRKKQKGSAAGKGHRKSNMPDPASMSQTSEKSGKME
ncbi:hypothetical protein KBC75_02175 [Candidatus Shapirobacteria bacterium]|nr:hypothetical protein [Candidatus Shapirobacteria bacterium]